MASITQLSVDWEKWIVHNLGRGVPAAVLIEEMVKKDFDHTFAAASVNQRAAEVMAGVPREPSLLAAGNHVDIDGHVLQVVSRVEAPEVAVLEHVLTDAECKELIALSRPKLARSTVVDRSTGAYEVIDARSSEGTYFLRGENPLVSRIEKRLAALTGMPEENGEGLQILHYGVGAEYTPHFDFFEPDDPGSAAHLERGGQRISTTIMYLNDVDAGGETIFPDIRFAVSARKGAAVYFSYCDSNGLLDRLTLHGGAPVHQGEKWIATRWVRERAHR